MKDLLIVLVILCGAWIAWRGVYFRTLLIRDKRRRFEQLAGLGLLHFEHKHMRDAIRYLRAAVDVEKDLDDPPGPERGARTAALLATLAYAHGVRRNYDAATSNALLAIFLDPTCALGHCALGMSAAAAGRIDDAVSHFDKAIHYSPQGRRRETCFTKGPVRRVLVSNAQVDSASEGAPDRARQQAAMHAWRPGGVTSYTPCNPHGRCR